MRASLLTLVITVSVAACSASPDEPTQESSAAVSSFTFYGPRVTPVEDSVIGDWSDIDGRTLHLGSDRRFVLTTPVPCDTDGGAAPCALVESGAFSGVIGGSLGGPEQRAVLFGAQYTPSDTIGTIDRLNKPNGGLSWFWISPHSAPTTLTGSTSLPVGGTRGQFTRVPPATPDAG